MDYYLIIYFFAGVIQDFLLTLNFRFVAKDRIAPAVISSFAVTVITMIVLYDIITRLDAGRSVAAIVIYALGIATGTYLGMRFKISTDGESQKNDGQ